MRFIKYLMARGKQFRANLIKDKEEIIFGAKVFALACLWLFGAWYPPTFWLYGSDVFHYFGFYVFGTLIILVLYVDYHRWLLENGYVCLFTKKENN